jgi:hypothetical protein
LRLSSKRTPRDGAGRGASRAQVSSRACVEDIVLVRRAVALVAVGAAVGAADAAPPPGPAPSDYQTFEQGGGANNARWQFQAAPRTKQSNRIVCLRIRGTTHRPAAPPVPEVVIGRDATFDLDDCAERVAPRHSTLTIQSHVCEPALTFLAGTAGDVVARVVVQGQDGTSSRASLWKLRSRPAEVHVYLAHIADTQSPPVRVRAFSHDGRLLDRHTVKLAAVGCD